MISFANTRVEFVVRVLQRRVIGFCSIRCNKRIAAHGPLGHLKEGFTIANGHIFGTGAGLVSSIFFFPPFFDLLQLFQLLVAPPTQSVVLLASLSVDIEYFPEPLQELQIVLVLALDEPLDVDVFVNAQLGETLLQDFEVSDKLILELGLPVDLGHGQLARVEDIGELAIDCPRAQLLDLAEIGFEEIVDPVQKFSPGQVNGVAGVDCDLVYHSSL